MPNAGPLSFEAVLFDIGGVFEIAGAMDFGQTWERNLELPSGAITVDLAAQWIGGAVGEVTLDQLRHDNRLPTTCRSLETVECVLDEMWLQYLGEPDDRLITWLQDCRPRYLTGLVSNSFVGAREREEEKYGFSAVVDTIVYSHEVGCLKPDPEIYLEACERLGVLPERCIFVDDSETAVEGAKALGMAGVHHQNTDRTLEKLEALLAPDKRYAP